jgi:aspartate/methionine/tyrosine aminotransferase
MNGPHDFLPAQILELLSEKGKAAIYPKMGILAQADKAKNKRYNATIGIAKEDDGSVMRLKSIAELVEVEPEDAFPYAPGFGRMNLRNLWQEMLYKKNPNLEEIFISKPVVTAALTHGLSITGYLFLDEGEELICSDLYWGNYRLVFEKWHKAKVKTYQTFKNGGFNVEGLREELLAPGDKKVVILNFPNNPSGYTITEEETVKIIDVFTEALSAGKRIVAIIDDAYFGLVYEEGVSKESFFVKLADLHENLLAVKVDGPTKEDYVWGFRVGFLTYSYKGMTPEAAEVLQDKTGGALRGNASNISNLSQSLLIKAYSSDTYEDEKREKFEILKNRYKEVKRVLNDHPEYTEVFEALPFNSGYFMCLKPAEGIDPKTVHQILLDKYDTGVILTRGLIRIAFSSTPLNDIPPLFENIYKASYDAKN